VLCPNEAPQPVTRAGALDCPAWLFCAKFQRSLFELATFDTGVWLARPPVAQKRAVGGWLGLGPISLEWDACAACTENPVRSVLD
jgi:hypothetical protein